MYVNTTHADLTLLTVPRPRGEDRYSSGGDTFQGHFSRTDFARTRSQTVMC